MKNNNDNQSKIVVITGATKGLGKALSLAFANIGYEVIGIYRSDSESAKVIKAEFREKDFRGCFIEQDITEEGNWAEFDEIIKTNKNKKFTLIANACMPFVPKPIHLVNWLEISEQLEVNVKGTFQIFKRLLPYMVKAREGTIISILSNALNAPAKGFAAYLTAKAALEGLMKVIAAENAHRGIRAFSVSPGFMETSLTQGWSEHLKTLIYSHDGNAQQPRDIASAILDLAEASNTKGQGENYLIDGIKG